MITKKSINKIQKRYYIDENKRIIKETKVKNVTLSEVISIDEIHELNSLFTRIVELEKTDETNDR